MSYTFRKIEEEFVPLWYNEIVIKHLAHEGAYNHFSEWEGGVICADREQLEDVYNNMVREEKVEHEDNILYNVLEWKDAFSLINVMFFELEETESGILYTTMS